MVKTQNVLTLTDLELFFDLSDLHHLLAQFERGGDGVDAGQSHVGWTRQRLVGVES